MIQISLMPSYGIPKCQFLLLFSTGFYLTASEVFPGVLFTLPSLTACMYRACARSLSYVFSPESEPEKWK
ncbi:unnamed protein product [Urochloa humidicola]